MMTKNGIIAGVHKTFEQTMLSIGNAIGALTDGKQLYRTIGEEGDYLWARYQPFNQMLSLTSSRFAPFLSNQETDEWLEGKWRRYSLFYTLDWSTKYKRDKALVFNRFSGNPVLVGDYLIQPRLYGSEISEALGFLRNAHTRSWRQDSQVLLKALDDAIGKPSELSADPIFMRYLGKPSGIIMTVGMFEMLMAVYAVIAMAAKRPCQLEKPEGVAVAGAIVEPSRFVEDPKLQRKLMVKDYILNQDEDLSLGAYGMPGIITDTERVEAYEPLIFTAVVISASMLRELHELYTAVFPTGLPQTVIENCPDDWVEYLTDYIEKELVQDDVSPAIEPSVKQEVAAAMPPEPQVPSVPEVGKPYSMVGLDKWQAKEKRPFLFLIDLFNTRGAAKPTQAKMKTAHLEATGKEVLVYETELQVFRDEQGKLMKKVVRFLEKPDDLPKQPYLPMVDKLTRGLAPRESLSRVKQGPDMLGYFLSMPYYKDLLALMSWIIDKRGLSQQAREVFRIVGIAADNSVMVRQCMLKDILQQNLDDHLLLSVCGISMAKPADEPISLSGIVIPTRKMRIIREALLQSIPDFFERVRAEDIPDTQGFAWLDYLDRVLGDEPVADTAAETVTPAEEIPAAVVTIEDVPIKDVLSRLFEGKDVPQNLRDALEQDLERIVLKKSEGGPVEEPVVEELHVEVQPVQETEGVKPDAVAEVAKVETPVERKVRQRLERVAKLKPEAILAGMDADTLWEEVLTNPNGYFACEVEGPARMTPELRALVREGRAEVAVAKEGTAKRYRRTVELETAIAQSKLAVMEWQHFTETVDRRRYPAKHWLEKLLGREINFNKANVVDITPDRIGELPGLVAGLHRKYPDRLCVVRVVMRHKVIVRHTSAERKILRDARKAEEKLTGKKVKFPETRVKTRQVSATHLHRQSFRFAEFPMLAVFPAGWMAPVAEPWMPGLFGTPYDPTLLDFCDTLSPEWWADLAKVIPAKDETRPMLDVRALQPQHS